MVPGLILLGFALQQHMHYGVIIIGWVMFTFGVMTTSVAVTTYAVDAYPTRPEEESSYINFMRVIGGFSVGYLSSCWVCSILWDLSRHCRSGFGAICLFA
jgi:hypothetical protein